MFKLTGLRSWNLNADDLDQTLQFYRDVLGVEDPARQNIAGANVARLRVGTQGIGLFDAAGGPRPGVPHHTFSCEGPADAEEMKRELESRGASVESIRIHGENAGYSVYVLDPSGNRLELSVDR